MRVKKAVLALLAGGLLLPAAGFAGRIDGFFRTEDATNGSNNEACTTIDDTDFGVSGVARAVNGNCLTEIFYFTFDPHKGSASVIKGNQTDGTGKVSQSIETFVQIFTHDNGLLDCPAANEYLGSASPEKCKANASVKAVESTDAILKSQASLTCNIGNSGADLDNAIGAPPDATQFTQITTAFGDRKDVKFTGKDGQNLKINHKGEQDDTANVACLGDD